ncbi:nuclear pore complex protein NUP35-like [Malus sylvestris]|uniref:nuclear pore complex protein NUP35-like n=1 Tax=Malus sylvestris TaxID=3752 RepID=UPI0021AC1787|nr:nuclear pore complex protein NUP35-like [Malus sylvestris]
MHILYQSYSDAQKALSKNGMQINGALIIGVKPLDPMQRHALNERVNNQDFMTFPPQPFMKHAKMNASKAPPRPYYLQNGNTSAQKSGGAIASSAKSLVSKVMDLMFGM